jgi:hypothetical protein
MTKKVCRKFTLLINGVRTKVFVAPTSILTGKYFMNRRDMHSYMTGLCDGMSSANIDATYDDYNEELDFSLPDMIV